jgi:hypothetical protein
MKSVWTNSDSDIVSMDKLASTPHASLVVAEIPVSLGELVDKITILRIKSDRISDASKHHNVVRELRELESVLGSLHLPQERLDDVMAQLRSINEQLWIIEDELRLHEARKCFDATFIDLARRVYLTNDRRAEVKRQISQQFNSHHMEEKYYARDARLPHQIGCKLT